MQIYLVSAVLIAVGLYGVLLKRNLLKVLLGVALMALGVASFVVTTGVDAVSQTVTLVAVVGGAAVVSLMIVTAVRLHEKYGTLDIREMRRLKG
jgi:multicomponent Na+:H+ antiporter subunit C